MDQSQKETDFQGELNLDQLIIKKAFKLSRLLAPLPLKSDIRPLVQELIKAREALLEICLKDISEHHEHTLQRKEARAALQSVLNRLHLILKKEMGERG